MMMMVMQKILYLRDNVGRLYVTRKEGGRGLTSIAEYVNTLT